MSRDWNSAYEKEDTPWDKGYAAPPLVEFLSGHQVKGKVLVPGCGAGHDVRLLAKQGADVLGLDIAPAGLARAQSFPVEGSETYALGDFLKLDTEYEAAFDLIFEHTCLCAIEPRERSAYANSVKKSLKPNGLFLAVFFRSVPDYDGDGPPHPISKEDIERLFGADFELIESFVPQDTYLSRPFGSEEVCLMRLIS